MKPVENGGRGGGAERGSSEIDEEVGFHIEGRAEELMAAGVPAEEAYRRARAAFGDVDRIRAELRAIDRSSSRGRERRERISGFVQDLRTGVRRLARSPEYFVVAAATLALGIGASVAMFTVLNAVLLRPLPYPGSERLVRIWPAENFNISLSREVGAALPAVESYTGVSHWGLTLSGDGEATVLRAAVVDAGYFDTFGVHPVLGRPFTVAETEPSRSGVVLLSHALWQSRFGGDPSVLGRRHHLGGYDHEVREVIGVMPAGHQSPTDETEVWIPLHIAAGRTVDSDSSWYVNEVVARLVPGATADAAQTQLRSLVPRLRQAHPGRIDEEIAQAASVVTLREALVGDVRDLLWILLAAVGLVLLIACGNIANLVLARTTGQRQEMAVRTALGASRGRLVRQQLAESSIVAVTGTLLGLAFARSLLVLARVSDGSGLPRSGALPLDGRVLTFTILACAGSLALFGLLPALRSTGAFPRSDVQGWTRGGSRDRASHRLNQFLVAGEIALATMLTTAAALALTSFTTLRSVDPGIDVEDVLALEVSPPEDRYAGDRLVEYYSELASRLAGLPGVETVGGIHLLPFTFNNWGFPYLAEGHPARGDEPLPSANFRVLAADYLEAVDQPLLEGRAFRSTDRKGAGRVMLINHAMADLLWPGESALGREIAIFGNIATTVVGVVGDVRQHALDREPRPEMYVPVAQWSNGVQMVFMLEGPRVVEMVREARAVVGGIDADVPVTFTRPLGDVLGESLARRRFVMVALASFGLLALLLGAVGVYGVMTNLLGARMRDFGLRLALGAAPHEVLIGALAAGLVPAGTGLVAGFVGAVAVAGLLRTLLFGVDPLALPIYLIVAVLLLTVALLASLLPARRAARSDPLAVLRAD